MVMTLLMLASAALGSLLFFRRKVPAGALIGAMAFSAVFHLLTGAPPLPSQPRFLVQLIAGAFIGQRVRRETLRQLRSCVKPAAQMILCVTGITVLSALALTRLAPWISLPTALVSMMPAGLSDISAIAADLGADTTVCALLQSVRIFWGLSVLPQLCGRICAHYAPGAPGGEGPPPGPGSPTPAAWPTLLLALAAGGLGKSSGLPAGALVCSLLAVAAYNAGTGRAYLPRTVRLAAQCVCGVYVGAGVSRGDLLRLREMLLPVLLVMLSCAAINFGVGFFLYWTNRRLGLPTCLFASIPAGVSDMALVSLDMGGDPPTVAVLQIVRYIGTLLTVPVLTGILFGGI